MIRCKIVKLTLNYQSNLICVKSVQKLRQTVRKALCRYCNAKDDNTGIDSILWFYWFEKLKTGFWGFFGCYFCSFVGAATVKQFNFKCHLDIINTDETVFHCKLHLALMQQITSFQESLLQWQNGRLHGLMTQTLSVFPQLWAFYSKDKEIPNRGFV